MRVGSRIQWTILLTKSYAEYVKNRDTFVKNYDLVKGILRMEDFYQVSSSGEKLYRYVDS